jgi:putative acetyltransferase
MASSEEFGTTFKAKNGKMLHFRPKRPTDTEMLWEMFSTLSQATLSNLIPPYTRERIESWTSNVDANYGVFIVAVIEENGKDRIVGNASLKFQPQEVFKHKCDFAITVHDEYQNLGIGTALLNYLSQIAKNKGLKKIVLTVNTVNLRALHIYQKAGFQIEGTLHDEMFWNGKYCDEYRMALFL